MKKALVLLIVTVVASLVLAACASQSGPGAATATTKVTNGAGQSLSTPTRAPSRSAAEIKATVATSRTLAGIHSRANKPCETCHGALPAFGNPTAPTTRKCLGCHGGSYEGHAGRTAELGEKNPHASHLGEVDCTSCHLGHQPFAYICSDCHQFAVPEKYAAGA